VQSRFAQHHSGPLTLLLGKVPFEPNRLFNAERSEVPVLRIDSKRSSAFADASTVASLWRLASFRNEKYFSLIRSLFGLCVATAWDISVTGFTGAWIATQPLENGLAEGKQYQPATVTETSPSYQRTTKQ